MKATPKSCSCRHCTFGKRTKRGQFMKKYDERKYRHKAKQKIASGEEVIDVAPKGNYYD